jgi:ribosomal protein L11 methyltransferase
LSVPYRVDVDRPTGAALDCLVALGALDAEPRPDGGIAALMPDGVTGEQIASVLGPNGFTVSPAIGRDSGSVWILNPRPISIGRLRIVPAGADPEPGALRLVDGAAFGTGLHPTTAMCLEALEGEIAAALPDAVLDVGTGSGVLALAALLMGVPRATGIDVEDEALAVASENARLNGLERRLQLAHGGPETLGGAWPLAVANVLAAPLVEMAPALVRRIGHHGRLVLSGIPVSVEEDVARAYRRLGMRHLQTSSRSGWTALLLQASW